MLINSKLSLNFPKTQRARLLRKCLPLHLRCNEDLLLGSLRAISGNKSGLRR